MKEKRPYQELSDKLAEVTLRLEEANDTIEAIRSGEIDALVLKNPAGNQIYTLKSADHTYRIFIEQMNEGAVTLNEKNEILYCNSQFASMLNLSLEKVIGQRFEKFIAADNVELYLHLIDRAWKSTTKGELNLQRPGGAALPVLLSLKTLALDEGLSMSVILTDLSSQKVTQKLLQQQNEQLEAAQKIAAELNLNLEHTVHARTIELEATLAAKNDIEEELRINQERLARILETMAEGVAIVDVAGNLTYLNPMAQKILGIQGEEFEGTIYQNNFWKNLRLDGSQLTPDDHPISIMLGNGREVYDQEISIQPNNGKRFYISINAAPLYDKNGVLFGGVGTFMDVTTRRKISQQKDEFISVASHELKTPLTSLRASLQLLTRLSVVEPDSPKVPEFIEKANKNLQKILYLTEDLMNVSKLQHGQLNLNKAWFNITEMINDCSNEVRAEGSHILFIKGETDLEVYADKQRVEQVVINLINNAKKYAPESKEIFIEVQTNSEWVKISVQDFGIGIPAEKLPHLFDRYYRVDPSGIQFSGLGLGLYISAEIIERHGGEIGVDSSIGKGSTFWFTLPLKNR